MTDGLPGRLGPYEVLARLSVGGMGEVLLGKKSGAHGFERLVALKIIRSDPRSQGDTQAMFMDEARLVARLTHPAIAQVYDFGEQDGRLWLAMEYVAGVPFNELARAPAAIIARAIAEACRGLHAAHELTDPDGRSMNVVHRDISPENLQLGFDGQVKVLDFGIALVRGREQPVTEAGFIKGKLRYMSPEQVRGDPVDRRADVYALGVVLHELLTGQPLLTDGAALEALGNRPREIAPPGGVLDAVVMKALAERPDDRYSTALELQEALMAVAGAGSLDRYAAEALREAAERHRAWLQQLVAGNATTHVAPPPSSAAPRLTVPDGQGTLPARSSRGRAVLGVVLAAVVGAAAWVALTLRDQPALSPTAEVKPAATTPTDAGLRESRVEVSIEEAELEPASGGRTPKPKLPRPTKLAEEAAAATGSAVVQVVAGETYGVVRVDGAVIGPTPQKVKVSAGAHLIEVLNPETNQVQLSQRVEVADGELRRVVAP